jgi:hypothetical protein
MKWDEHMTRHGGKADESLMPGAGIDSPGYETFIWYKEKKKKLDH